MSRNRFAATRLTPAEAMDLWSRSDEASAFTHPDYLEQLVDEVEWWGVERSGEIVAAWPLLRAVAGGEIAPPPFCYYVGPMFSSALRHDNDYHRYWSLYTEILSTLIAAVISAHPRFKFSLPLGLTDVRVLQWWNFENPDSAGFSVTPRYTARIDLSDFPDEDTLYQSFARTRKRAVDRWAASPPTVVNDISTERVIAWQESILRRGGGVASPTHQTGLRRLVELVESGAGSVIGLVPQEAEDVAAAIILLDGPNESNGIFCAADESWRDKGLIAWVIWLSLLRTRSLNKRWFDFNGANSPGRSADKHFYGAKAELYFDCSFGTGD